MRICIWLCSALQVATLPTLPIVPALPVLPTLPIVPTLSALPALADGGMGEGSAAQTLVQAV